MYQLVHHHRTSPVGVGLQGTFSYSVLKVSSYSTESKGLVLNFAIVDESWFTKWVIVSSICLHLDAELTHEGLEFVLGLQGLTYS
jgi:hypothetical protein